MRYSQRIKELSPYPFAELDKKKRELKAKGVDMIDVSIGDPDLPTPKPIVEKMQEAVAKPENHIYPSYDGSAPFKEGVARWYQTRFGVTIDPATEICALIGSKEGVANIHYAFVDAGDVVLFPSPGYPVCEIVTRFAGGTPHLMPLRKENDFLPDFKAVPKNIWEKGRLMHLNYPNNPTAALANTDFFGEAVRFAKQHNTIIAHDAAYSEIYYDHQKPISFLQTPGAKEVGIEIHSLSKTFNMTGWRLGFAVGNREVIHGLAKIKTNIDSGPFSAIQETGIFCLDHEQELTDPIRKVYQDRRDAFVEALRKIGYKVEAPKATFYIWMEVPGGPKSADFAARLLKQGVVATPGTAFGSVGEGFIRFTLTKPKERLVEAAKRIGKLQ